ncbi:MAG: hypothetical protein F6K65_30480 [Moorea sp. SIO3C2]|nr:hypothetical protein [Moorena sp. SIO3C2]
MILFGTLTDADADPTVVIWRNAIATSIVVSVTRISQGKYSYSFDVPSNWVEGDRVGCEVSYSLQAQPKTSGIVNIGTVSESLELRGLQEGSRITETVVSNDTAGSVIQVDTDSGKQFVITEDKAKLTRTVERTN